ncbi:MAG TPA: 4-(cytidine 5'-diphospho)-2-C-methyl-D-erythritol kinase [Elusimicrobiota bacterium]|nr:4-(cytidine 5'-diphospho)-2-C-methyl-D-erythritol kinase [Elusimicrobiota bacterium]
MKIQCPAKVNLFLEIVSKRQDGYHNIASLMAKIHLYDVLDLDWAPGGELTFLIAPQEGAPEVPAGPDNLVFRAAKRLCEAVGVKRGVRLVLSKKIPVGAGLGGGSSDAAGALLGLAKLFEMPKGAQTRKTLFDIGRSLGADVPFFLQPAAFALARGIGDRLKPLKVGHTLPYMILAYPGVAISTAESYKALPKASRSDVLTRLSQLDKLARGLEKGRPIERLAGLFFNRMEQAGLASLRTVEQARAILERAGLSGVRMSGSGSSVFGFAASHEDGRRALKRLSGYPWKIFLTSLGG